MIRTLREVVVVICNFSGVQEEQPIEGGGKPTIRTGGCGARIYGRAKSSAMEAS